jgi:hypothetical protein
MYCDEITHSQRICVKYNYDEWTGLIEIGSLYDEERTEDKIPWLVLKIEGKKEEK